MRVGLPARHHVALRARIIAVVYAPDRVARSVLTDVEADAPMGAGMGASLGAEAIATMRVATLVMIIVATVALGHVSRPRVLAVVLTTVLVMGAVGAVLLLARVDITRDASVVLEAAMHGVVRTDAHKHVGRAHALHHVLEAVRLDAILHAREAVAAAPDARMGVRLIAVRHAQLLAHIRATRRAVIRVIPRAALRALLPVGVPALLIAALCAEMHVERRVHQFAVEHAQAPVIKHAQAVAFQAAPTRAELGLIRLRHKGGDNAREK